VVPGAHGNTLTVERGCNIMCVYAGYGKGDKRSAGALRWPKQFDTLKLPEPKRCLARQKAAMKRKVVQADMKQKVQGFSHAHDR
jgi:hypothetical protein